MHDWNKQEAIVKPQPIQNLVYIAVIKLKDSEDTITVQAYLMSKLYYYLERIDDSIIEEVTIKRVDQQIL